VAGVSDDDEQIAAIRARLQRAAQRLRAAGARNEALGRFVAPPRLMFFAKDRLIPVVRVWRLGVLLLGHDETLYQTGAITRAVPPPRAGAGAITVSASIRREYRAAAASGRFAPGDTVNYDAVEIKLESRSLRETSGPLFLGERGPLVRWNNSLPDSTAMPLERYLDDRVGSLIEPPEGA